MNILTWLRKHIPSGRQWVIAGPYLFLALFFLLPFLLVVKISFAQQMNGIPPYTSLATWHDQGVSISLNFGNYKFLLSDSLYVATYLSSVKTALITTIFCLLIGYPVAYYVARSKPETRNLLMMAMMLPFWTSFLIRVYAWIGILKKDGILNQLLLWAHLIKEPIELYHTNTGMYIGMVYTYVPFLIMPLYAHLVKMDLTLLEAAYDLGARPWTVFTRITLPLSRNGIIAGAMLVFIPAVGEYVIPELLGGSNTLMLGSVMWDEFNKIGDWPMASAVTCAMVLLLLVPMAIFQHFQAEPQERK